MSREIKPLSPRRWEAFEELFGRAQGGRSGCWCMWWRLSRKEREGLTREERRLMFKSVVDDGKPVGIILFDDGRPIGWCAVSSRAELPSLACSPVARPIDDRMAWCVSCFFIKAGHRR